MSSKKNYIKRKNRKSQISNCKYCGKKFLLYYSRKKNGQKYCSHACGCLSRTKKIPLMCKNCGKEFQTVPSAIKLRNPSFCSRKCSQMFSRTGEWINCLSCGLRIYKKRGRKNMKYCSIACRNKLAYKKRRTISCRFCGELTTNYWGNNMCNKCAKMRTKYGLSVENITKLYPYIQKKQCQICLEIKKDKNRRAVNIDHDHETGEVRGIVCNICNVLLSHYEKLRKTVSSDSYWPFLEDYLKNPPAQKIIKENPILHKKSPVK